MRGSFLLTLLAGVGLGTILMTAFAGNTRTVQASTNDRYQDYIICTGAVAINPRAVTDGVWMLDYRSGKLMGTVIDRTVGKIVGWAEVDLVSEFAIAPKQDVHFMMTTGNIAQGQAALYIVEISTGKFGIYTMGPNPEGQGLVIRRHDMSSFRSTTTKKE
jgi:hypothetical protein